MNDQTLPLGERRPIAARERRIFQRLSARMAVAGATPNAISIAGMVCCLAAGGALAATPHLSNVAQRIAYLAAAALIQLRLLANMLDGMVALDSGKSSPVGGLYNEVPDRISDAGTLIGAGFAVASSLIVGLIATCVAIFVAYVRVQAKVSGAPQDFCGPMAKQHRMALMTFTLIYLALAPSAWRPVWRGQGLMTLALLIIIIGGLWTALRRLFRAAKALRKASA
jgi:phosphatidylglycerophosphate synthase